MNLLRRALILFLGFANLCLSGSICAYDYDVAICTIFKDCAPYLKEWIEFHRMLGVEHFFLYDNSSTDEPLTVLAPYIQNGVVTLTMWPTRNQEKWGKGRYAWVFTTQKAAYEHCATLAKDKVKWLAFIDSDEFITPLQHPSIPAMLESRDDLSAYSLQWLVYGTSNVYEIPADHLMIELLTLRAYDRHKINKHFKVIVKPEKIKNLEGAPHGCRLLVGAKVGFLPKEEARITHYINRTVEFLYKHKIENKKLIDNTPEWSQKLMNYWINLGNDVEDLSMQSFIPELRARMGYD